MPRKANKYRKNTLKDSGGNKSRKEKSGLKRSGKLTGFFKNEKTHKVFGLFLSLFSIYLLIVFVSYFFTWWKDYDIIHNSTFWQIIFNKDVTISNVGGRFGVAISNLFITKMFGISSFLFIFLFFISGLKLAFKIRIISIGKAFRYSLFIILWLPAIHLNDQSQSNGSNQYEWKHDQIKSLHIEPPRKVRKEYHD